MTDKYKTLFVTTGLTLAVLAVFWQVHNFDFIIYDDHSYVSENNNISTGLKWNNIVWVFTNRHVGNWHPLTGLSHILDCQFFDLNAGRHHTVNLLFHIANTLLLFTVLRKITAAFWQSAFVAALFALHPLHVESVAWISERKDVLSTLFWILTMWAYFRYIQKPAAGRYILTLVLFALGLMSKPMLVTLPFVLLLLDYWPLERIRGLAYAEATAGRQRTEDRSQKTENRGLLQLIIEKMPFFILAVTSSVITVIVQHHAGAMAKINLLTPKLRISNALVSYIEYIYKLFVPAKLAIYYPYNVSKLSTVNVLLAAAALLIVSILVIRFAAKHKYLPVGWFWFLGTLIPVIGIVQVGGQALADRYTYVPYIGLFIIIAWGANDLLANWSYRKVVLSLSSFAVIAALSVFTWFQVSYWQNSLTLFGHAAKVTNRNYMAYENIGLTLMDQNNLNDALDQFNSAVNARPNDAEAHYDIGIVYGKMKLYRKEIDAYKQAIEFNPDLSQAWYNMGVAYRNLNLYDDEIDSYKQAIKAKPDYAEAYSNLGAAYARLGRDAESIEPYKQAIKFKPDFVDAYCNLGVTYSVLGRYKEAIQTLEQAVKLKPDSAQAHCSLGVSYLLSGDKDSALKELNILKPIDPNFAAKLQNLMGK